MAFLPLKFALVITNFVILFLIVMILIKHRSDGFNIQSWSAGFNILCVLWLSLRGAFWALTVCTINYWIGSTFYILYWVPTPISFGAFMLIPLFFAHLLYRHEWDYYWGKIWWMYIATTVSLAVFMISWSVISAIRLRHDLDCINSTASGPIGPSIECYNTEFSSTAFRFVTSVCFLFLATNCAMFGKKILSLGEFDTSIYLGPSIKELYRVNMFLFASFLSRGLYECLDVMNVFHIPSIPLQGDQDVTFLTFFVFMFWDYFPTLLWVVVVTGRDVVYYRGSRGRGYSHDRSINNTPMTYSLDNTNSYENLSDLMGLDDGEGGMHQELPYFHNADGGGQKIVGTPLRAVPFPRRERGTAANTNTHEMDGLIESLGRRYALPCPALHCIVLPYIALHCLALPCLALILSITENIV
jgi:hypothetical protein